MTRKFGPKTYDLISPREIERLWLKAAGPDGEDLLVFGARFAHLVAAATLRKAIRTYRYGEDSTIEIGDIQAMARRASAVARTPVARREKGVYEQ